MKMKSDNEAKRKYIRWYFWMPEEPFKSQASGLAVQLKQPGWFRHKTLGRAVIKDISMGGAGVLVSNRIEVPDKIMVSIPDGDEFSADVVYQRDEGELFTFLGITWSDTNDEKRMALINQVQELTNLESRLQVTTVEPEK
ncbi:PilZ domain-containing protein [Vibrio agarivorans]|uniref:PilZ domain-containing protein n=1 Tax=Vibrio agarivorans TaxID=153622 RepID=A0ABT7XWG9_9VIBR|nr:PilZ domain-containing protein [Vibrio agarivorans]MDN2480127.1 PilZ domain-containing protein [Vibrio agarivorans]